MPTTNAPPAPPNGPSDWSTVVQGNAFANTERLGIWLGGVAVVPPNTDPSSNFASLGPMSLGSGEEPRTIYVLVHGWAPGYRSAVEKANGDILWWGSNASVPDDNNNPVWASNWAWSAVPEVNDNGVLQSILINDPQAVAVAYSWIDDSGTTDGYSNLDQVYQSEAWTHVNGMRLANALQLAINPSFWTNNGVLRLIGHSHGSKVATVAALTLQQRGYDVSQLTICDAPEYTWTLDVNGSNLLGFYLNDLQVQNAAAPTPTGTFVDNYVSYFGVGYAGSTNADNVIEVMLQPSELYGKDDPPDKHTYAAAWYGAAAVGAKALGDPPVGLAWPPPQKPNTPALNQNWPTAHGQSDPWILQTGSPLWDVYKYSTQALEVDTVWSAGNVRGAPKTGLYFGPTPGTWPQFSIFEGKYPNGYDSDCYGMAFDVTWTRPQAGDYLVVTMESPIEHVFGVQECLLVMDGQSAPAGKMSIAVNSYAWSSLVDLKMYIYFLAAPKNTTGQVVFSNFRGVYVNSASGILRARRAGAAAERLTRHIARMSESPGGVRGGDYAPPTRQPSRTEAK